LDLETHRSDRGVVRCVGAGQLREKLTRTDGQRAQLVARQSAIFAGG
jgi:hypothetical protein